MNLTKAKEVLRIDSTNTANDALITSLVDALPSYIEITTGMSAERQATDSLVETVSGFLLILWYHADHADDVKLNRTIDALLKAITLKARSGASNG